MPENKLKYIVIEGPPGTGKNILTEFLAEKRGARKVIESHSRNPFIRNFYKDKSRFAFTTQMAFLSERYQTLMNISHMDLFHDSIICDFLFERNFIYANILLDSDELELFNKISQFMKVNLPKPDLVIYIQADLTMVSRKEKSLYGDDIISALCDGYNHFFFHYEQSPILIIRPDQLDFNSEDDLEEINRFLEEPINGTVYFSRGRELF